MNFCFYMYSRLYLGLEYTLPFWLGLRANTQNESIALWLAKKRRHGDERKRMKRGIYGSEVPTFC